MTEYLMLTPGPTTTTPTVKQSMLNDWSVLDSEYTNDIVKDVTTQLLSLACCAKHSADYDCVLLPGNGNCALESVLGSAINKQHKLLLIDNGQSGQHMAHICQNLGINTQYYRLSPAESPDISHIDRILAGDSSITHVAFVHIEINSGLANPIDALCQVIKQHQRRIIVDANASFGGVELDLVALDIDYLIANPSQCLQSIDGFSFVIAKNQAFERCQQHAHSHNLNLHRHWKNQQNLTANHLDIHRFNASPQIVASLQQALIELDQEGGISARALRYSVNQKLLAQGMLEQDFQPLVSKEQQSTVISAFYAPNHKSYAFEHFYQLLKHQGYIIYPGAIDGIECFRIANIGHVYPADIKSLLVTIEKCRYWLRE